MDKKNSKKLKKNEEKDDKLITNEQTIEGPEDLERLAKEAIKKFKSLG